MFEQLHARDRIEPAGQFHRQRFHRLHPIIDADAGFEPVQFGDLDQFRRQVERDDLGALARHRLAEQAGTATDVQHLRARQSRARGDVAQPGGIERMQRLLRALRVPPAVGERAELVEFGLAEVAVGVAVLGHHEIRIAAMRVRHCFALATSAAVSMSINSRACSLAQPAIQTSLTWWRPVA